MGIVIVVQCQSKLPQMILTSHPPCRFTSCLNCRQKKSDQNTDDRNNDEEFNQSKT